MLSGWYTSFGSYNLSLTTELDASQTDDCGDTAITLAVDQSMVFSTSASTLRGRGGCIGGSSPTVWVQFVAPTTGQYIVTTDSAVTSFDTILALW